MDADVYPTRDGRCNDFPAEVKRRSNTRKHLAQPWNRNVRSNKIWHRSLACKVSLLLTAFAGMTAQSGLTQNAALPTSSPATQSVCVPASKDTAYIPVDSWIYPAINRLYAMGYLDLVFMDQRPWTRETIGKMLGEVAENLEVAEDEKRSSGEEAQKIYAALVRELNYSPQHTCLLHEENLHVEQVYSATRVLTGTPLRDSHHLGQSIINDYGRPYANGVNLYNGFSATAMLGPLLAHVRGEFQQTPASMGYSDNLAQYLSESVDLLTYANPTTGIPYYQATIPRGALAGHGGFTPLEAYLSTRFWQHEISFGRKDEWLGPAQGGAFAYSNNAENLYALHIDRQEPLDIPWLSQLFGPFRYEFVVGQMQGHTYIPAAKKQSVATIDTVNPGKPWMHLEVISFKPSRNLEVSFERTVIWGGQGHEGISLHSFLRSFFSLTASSAEQKNSNRDPGSRYGAFSFSYRLPYMREWLTLYSDAEVHDDLCACDSPRAASWRPGLYLSHLPQMPKLDVRAEAVWTDASVTKSKGGRYMYWEGMDRQGYTNKGQIFGDWIGREDKGGQAWITYHLSGNELLQLSYRRQKAAKDFIEGGTTLNDFGLQVTKRLGKEFEVRGDFTWEDWKIPVYHSGRQNVTSTTIQITWFPQKR